MLNTAEFLLTIGSLLLLGLVTSALAHRTRLPRVTLLLLFGIVIGPQALDLIPPLFTDRFDLIADLTLLMVGFLLGGKLTRDSLKTSAWPVMVISICAALLTAVLVAAVLWWAGLSFAIALLLGCIASATAPAAILDVVAETNPDSRFSQLLLSIVAVDDLWALILFGMGMSLVSQMTGHGVDEPFLMAAFEEMIGAVILGVMLGVPSAYATGRIRPGQPMLTEALGVVCICGGLALWLGVSYLIAAMVLGAVIVNLAEHHDYPFHAIEGVESLFMLIFFVIAGASLDLSSLGSLSLIGLLYILMRTAGKFAGAWLGCRLSRTDALTRRWLGLALLPQAGVPIGLALVASAAFPEHRQTLLSVVIASTVLFDLIGPVLTRRSVLRATR
ncbi:cation:proton antiporter [Reinekea blandensis]|uniref:Cation/H+ exchanger transmembrane domain-containing protein n=1 Tax=Reinekea blandensis MED297 TaxID=314283 RepID=A4BD43_9GAMM|nr:cation:proton antiporter [Reinekea blandensis]EAR09787.1 hypothetical protein MED297_05544 [Reinekea sp. MED297] [Reinekea blandensis MED297]